MMLQRRDVLYGAAIAALGLTASPPAWAQRHPGGDTAHHPSSDAATASPQLLGCWRGPRADDTHQVGRLDLDTAARQVRIGWAVPLPSRAHGLLALPGGDLLVLAMRPGRWLMRVRPEPGAGGQRAQVLRLRWLDDEPDGHRLDGHVQRSLDGRVLYTPQTDRQGQGWIAVRDADTLALLARWPLPGVDPHHLLLDGQGDLMLALGGIQRTPEGRKIDLERMAPALLRLSSRDGGISGRWTLPDPRLSMRHLAWSAAGDGGLPRLGVALQAEHDDPAARERAPLLAWWDGERLETALDAVGGAGYAGDIAPTTGAGWVVSAQMASRALAWMPGPPTWAATVAQLQQPCALAATADGAVWLGAASGAARWHPRQPPRLLPWPQTMVLDNHWVAPVA